MYLMSNTKYFESENIHQVQKALLELDEEHYLSVSSIAFYDPTTILIVSILGGSLGIDRFMIGDTGLGVGKLLTGGGCGIWAIVDWFLIQNAAKRKNLEKFITVIQQANMK